MKKILPIMMIIIIILLVACESMYMRTAKLAIRDEDNPDKAIENLKMEIQQNPNNAEAYLFLSKIYGQYKEDYYQAYFYAKKAVEIDPAKKKDVDLIYLTTWSQLHNQGLEALNALPEVDQLINYMKRNELLGQITEEELSDLIKNDLGNEKLHNLLKLTSMTIDDLAKQRNEYEKLRIDVIDEALIKLGQAHEIQPDSLITFELIGDTYIRADSIDKALDVYLQIYDRDPENTFALNRIATTYYNQEEFDNAIKYFLVLHELEPDNSDWLYNLWVAEIRNKNPEKAVEYAKKAVAIDPTNKDLLYNIADTQFNNKNYEEAAKYYKKVIVVDPTELEALKYVCYCLSNTKNYEELVIYAQMWLDVNPDSTEAQQFLNLARQMLNK